MTKVFEEGNTHDFLPLFFSLHSSTALKLIFIFNIWYSYVFLHSLYL